MRRFKIPIFILAACLASCKIKNHSAIQAASEAPSGGGHPSPRTKPQNQIMKFALKCGKDSLRFFYDDSLSGDMGVTHTWHEEIGYPYGYFVERSFYEGGDWILVSKRACADLELFGPVAFNPSGSKFASVGQDNVMGVGENGVQILSHSVDGGDIQIELEDRLSINGNDQFAPAEWKWSNDSVFIVSLRGINENRLVREYRNENGMWTIRNVD